MSAQDAVGSYYRTGLGKQIKETIRTDFLYIDETRERLHHGEQLLEGKNQEELNPYSLKIPTLNSVICEQTVKDLKQYLLITEELVENLERDIYLVCEEMASNLDLEERFSFTKRYLGEFLLSSQSKLFTKIPFILEETVEKYHLNKQRSPNYPTRIPFQAGEFLETKVLQYMLEIMELIRSDNLSIQE